MLGSYVLILFYFLWLSRGYDFTIQENGLQVDQPPEIGNISIVRITIMKNDNAEGIIEFDPRYIAFEGRFSNLICKFTTTFWITVYLDMTFSVWIPIRKFSPICVHVCVYTYICIYLYMYLYMHLYIYTFILKIYFELLLDNLEFCLYMPKLNG